MINKLILLLVTGLLFVPYTFAESERLPKPSNLPIEVTAKQLEAHRQQRQAVFSGEVVAKQGDMTLYCDRLVVYSLPDQDEVERLEAIGNVRVVQIDRTATAQRAIYYQLVGKLVLFGDAKVHQGPNLVSGEEITVFIREERSLVKSGDSGRVKAVLFPEKKQDKQ